MKTLVQYVNESKKTAYFNIEQVVELIKNEPLKYNDKGNFFTTDLSGPSQQEKFYIEVKNNQIILSDDNKVIATSKLYGKRRYGFSVIGNFDISKQKTYDWVYVQSHVNENTQFSDVKIKMSKMHDALGIPRGTKICEVYTDGDKLAEALLEKASENEVAGMLAFSKNINPDKTVYSDALSYVNKNIKAFTNESLNEIVENMFDVKKDENDKYVDDVDESRSNVYDELKDVASDFFTGIETKKFNDWQDKKDYVLIFTESGGPIKALSFDEKTIKSIIQQLKKYSHTVDYTVYKGSENGDLLDFVNEAKQIRTLIEFVNESKN